MPSASPHLGAKGRTAGRGEAAAIAEVAADRHLSVEVRTHAAFCPYFPNQMTSFRHRRFGRPYTIRPVTPSEPKVDRTQMIYRRSLP